MLSEAGGGQCVDNVLNQEINLAHIVRGALKTDFWKFWRFCPNLGAGGGVCHSEVFLLQFFPKLNSLKCNKHHFLGGVPTFGGGRRVPLVGTKSQVFPKIRFEGSPR